jgi:hypothetical protein
MSEREYSDNPMSKFWLGGISFVIGVFLLMHAFGIIGGVNTDGFVDVKGRVVGYNTQYDDGQRLDGIIAEYVVEGQKYTIESSVFSSHPKHIGEIVKIKYNPNNPVDAVFDDANENGTLLSGIIGGLFSLVGAIMFGDYVVKSLKRSLKKDRNI